MKFKCHFHICAMNSLISLHRQIDGQHYSAEQTDRKRASWDKKTLTVGVKSRSHYSPFGPPAFGLRGGQGPKNYIKNQKATLALGTTPTVNRK